MVKAKAPKKPTKAAIKKAAAAAALEKGVDDQSESESVDADDNSIDDTSVDDNSIDADDDAKCVDELPVQEETTDDADAADAEADADADAEAPVTLPTSAASAKKAQNTKKRGRKDVEEEGATEDAVDEEDESSEKEVKVPPAKKTAKGKVTPVKKTAAAKKKDAKAAAAAAAAEDKADESEDDDEDASKADKKKGPPKFNKKTDLLPFLLPFPPPTPATPIVLHTGLGRDNATVTVVALAKCYIGRVIGRGGEMIRELGARSGCVDVKVDQEVAEESKDIVILKKVRKDGVEAVYLLGESDETEWKEIETTPFKDDEKLPRLLTLIGTPANIAKALEIYSLLACEAGATGTVVLPIGSAITKVLQIPYDRIGRIIGTKGQEIKNLQNLSKAKIQVDHTTDKDGNKSIEGKDGFREVEIIGGKKEVQEAERLIAILMSDRAGDRNGYMGSGSNSSDIGRRDDFRNNNDFRNNGGGRFDDRRRDDDDRRRSTGDMRGDDRYNQNWNMGNGGQAGPYGSTPTNEIVLMTLIPSPLIGKLIGLKGVTIGLIQSNSRTVIEINKGMEPCEVKVKGYRLEDCRRGVGEIRETVSLGFEEPIRLDGGGRPMDNGGAGRGMYGESRNNNNGGFNDRGGGGDRPFDRGPPQGGNQYGSGQYGQNDGRGPPQQGSQYGRDQPNNNYNDQRDPRGPYDSRGPPGGDSRGPPHHHSQDNSRGPPPDSRAPPQGGDRFGNARLPAGSNSPYNDRSQGGVRSLVSGSAAPAPGPANAWQQQPPASRYNEPYAQQAGSYQQQPPQQSQQHHQQQQQPPQYQSQPPPSSSSSQYSQQQNAPPPHQQHQAPAQYQQSNQPWQQQQQPQNNAPPPQKPSIPPPPPLPPVSQWKSTKTEDGAIYFYNSLTGESSWTKPSGYVAGN